MHELIAQILGYIRGIWRYRWWILGVAWVVSIAGWAVVYKLPDQYEASARVFVDTQTLLKPILKGLAIQGNDQRRLLLMTKTLLSRPNLEKVMRMSDLDLQVKTDEETDAMIESLKDKIKLTGTNRVNLYTISYSNEKPELAKLVVKSLLTLFVESNLGDSRKEQDSVRQFLEQQIGEYEQRLIEAEERKTRFKQKNLAFLPGEKGGYYQRLETAQQALIQAQLELKIQQDRLRVLRQQVEGEVPSFGIVEEPEPAGSSALDGRIQGLQQKMDELLLRYTERHPDVQAIQSTIKNLSKQRDRELAAAIESGSVANFSSLDKNPVYQQMRISFAEVEADVAAKQVVVKEYKKRIENLKAAVDKVLQVEAEQSQLNRDYGILKKQHQGLLSRLESARLSSDADTRSDTARFRIIDPPRVPAEPSGPPRVLMSSAVPLGGIAIGIILAFLMSQIRPTFDDRKTLNEFADLPVLGSISMVWTRAQIRKRQRRHVGFLLGLLGLVSVYSLVVAVYLFELDWMGYLMRVPAMVGI